MIRYLSLLFLLYPTVTLSARLPEASAVPGGIVHIKLGTDKNKNAPQVSYQGKPVLVTTQQGDWVALVGIPLSAKLGQHLIEVKAKEKESFNVGFSVQKKEYPAQYIEIKNKRMVNPNPKDMKRITRESIPIKQALQTWTAKSDVQTDFIVPANGRLSSPFGLKRFFNKQPKKPHSGLDIAAPTGTDIIAPAKGTVLNTGNYFFNGNTVFLDHGQGLITGYFHMSKINVTEGQKVLSGGLLGKIGETGRVTGPHLHWNVYLNQTKVNPALFIEPYLADLRD